MSDASNDSGNPEKNPNKPDSDKSDFEVDILSRLREVPRPHQKFPRRAEDPIEDEEEPEEDFWATFSMITHTGERFVINVCFASRRAYNTEMKKFETAKNVHIVLQDVNGESVVIKREMLLHVLPQSNEELPERKRW